MIGDNIKDIWNKHIDVQKYYCRKWLCTKNHFPIF